MKSFKDMLQMVQDQDVVVCRCSSGMNVAYEPAHFNGLMANGNIKMVTESGTKFQIKDQYGAAIMAGKAEDCFIKLASDVNDNYFKVNVL